MNKIIIIGAGVSGMSAGIHGQLNGFETEIHEMNSFPGGECNGWERGEYHFDGCIHYLMGSNPCTPLNQVWQNVGALDNAVEIINTECFCQFEENGQTIKIYKNIDRLEEHLLDISPEDSLRIKETCKAIKEMYKMDMPVDKPMDMYSFAEMLKILFKMFPHMPYLKKYNRMTIKEFALQFKNPLLQHAFRYIIPEKYDALTLLSVLSSMNSGDCGWPIGGSRQMAGRMEKKYISLGGKIHYKSKVEKIRIAEGKATGIILADGSERLADLVISSTDMYFALNKMLEGKFTNKKYEKAFADANAYPLCSTIQVSVGVYCDLANQPDVVYCTPSHPIIVGGRENMHIGLKHYCYDKTIAPKGKSVITVQLETDYDWWKKKHIDRDIYKAEKKKIAAEVCALIEERFPETREKFEKTDVATPLTYERYCNAFRGSYMSWKTTPKSKIKFLPVKLQGLKEFYLTGQWTMPIGGLPMAVLTGKWVIQHICKDRKRKFTEK